MGNLMANSEIELERINHLLDKSLPSYRKAFSDRTAWLMACCSELAYIRFNPLFAKEEQKGYFLEHISKLIDDDKKSSLIKLIDLFSYDPDEELKKLINELKTLRIKLIETYDNQSTQAILLTYADYVILAFRGTEPKSIKDIRADAKGTLTQCESGGMVHTGFKEAYELVAMDIQQKLNEEEYANKPLFITGHSLGGALATIAAKKLKHQAGIAACYTFGSPRVGNKEWICSLKTPVYRLVNAADAVTMLPPGGLSVDLISRALQFIPGVGIPLRQALLTRFGGYLHGGNMRYLENVPTGQYDKTELLYSVSLFYRLKGLFYNQLRWTNILSDHSITVYRKKLAVIAEKRNP